MKRALYLLFLLASFAFPALSRAEEVPAKGNFIIQGKIIYESNQDARVERVKSLYLWENGKIRKFFKGGSHPRWSPDGQKIACVLWEQKDGKVITGNIGILDGEGKLIQKIETQYSALELEWMPDQNDQIVYVGWPRNPVDSSYPTYLSKVDLVKSTEEVLYTTDPVGKIQNVEWSLAEQKFVFELFDRKGGKMETFIAFFDPSDRKIIGPFYEKAFSPVLLQNAETLVFTTNHTPIGEKIPGLHWSVLAKYNIQTKDFEVIRPTGWVRNMRLSRDGKYLYTSEPVERDGVAIHIFSVEDLKRPLYRIEPMIDEFGEPSQDLNPDWIAKNGV